MVTTYLVCFLLNIGTILCSGKSELLQDDLKYNDLEQLKSDIKFLKKEFIQMKMENKQLQMDNKRLRKNINDINQTVEDINKKEKEATVLRKCNPSLSSSGDVKRILLPAATNSPDQQTKVAFTAALTHNISLGELHPVIYDKLISNVGNAYDTVHGRFTAPVKGVYILSGSIFNVEGHIMHMEMVKNGVQLVAFFGDSDDNSMGSQTIVIVLEANDIVWMRHFKTKGFSSIDGSTDQPINTFSGALLFQL
ncbi:unnamed protein product [Mytilus coruscus]|uniref:C1q domain-containing protein n=1 Tax=Mytilus coruscus TaxID=42192 RepID=A0A6J8BZU9_MYTCO|nr:unnamed protein product [Mytilus coruscus]